MAADLQIPTQELNAFDLPGVCVVTGAQEGVTFRAVKFWWYPRWVPLLIFFPWGGLLLAFIVGLATRKQAKGELPFTDRGWSAWKRSKWTWGLSVMAFFAGLFVCLYLILEAAGGFVPEWVVGAGLAMTAGLPVAGWFLAKPSMIVVRRIENGRLTVRLPSADATTRIHSHLFPAAAGVVQGLPVRAPAPTAAAGLQR